jgi:hypothetical protein
MPTAAEVEYTFQWVQPKTSLEVFAKYAIGGVAEERLWSAVQGRGRAAARELLQYLKELPTKANCSSANEFVTGFNPVQPGHNREIARYEQLLSEAFELMLIPVEKEPDRTPVFGEKLLALIREVADYASPKLRAWGV